MEQDNEPTKKKPSILISTKRQDKIDFTYWHENGYALLVYRCIFSCNTDTDNRGGLWGHATKE